MAVGFIGVSSGIGYYLWLWALNHTTPTKVTVFLALSPVTATILGGVFLAERVSTTFCGAYFAWPSAYGFPKGNPIAPRLTVDG